MYATLFLAHGSFGSEGKWFRPGGTFHEALKKEAAVQNETITPWLWSGGISDEDIIFAAGQFVELFLSLPTQTSKTLCAHSNGGNVFAFATMLLAALYETYTITTDEAVAEQPTEEQPTEELRIPHFLKKPFLRTELTKSREVHYTMNPKTEAALTAVFSALKHKADLNPPLHRSPTIYPITLFFCMGTPINYTRFDIDMRVVKQAINLYSPGDFIQTLVGSRLFPEHERRANIQVRLHHSDICPHPIDPCHKNIRHALVGQWLLHLPELIAASYENAALYTLQSGIVLFSETENPTFTAIPYSDLMQSFSTPSHAALSSSDDEESFDGDDWGF